MSFVADLHIHSRYSRATSKQCDIEHLAWWARRKGIAVVATGDFTHPGWRAELKEKLVPAEPGLFRPRDDLQAEIDRRLPPSCAGPVRFMLSVEISNIYKRHDRVRKVHNLVYTPDFEHAERIVERLERIGNLRSDGRPILGLDSRDLLEIVLEVGNGSYLVPAHIWTPWFSLFGAKSGFDRVEDCFGDLSEHVFALETGLSADPAMIWQLSALDRFRLVSNSDAHSPSKLGREANLFGCGLDFFAMRRVLETGEQYGGTVEFYPEEGKYHLDGHRKCGVRMTPSETREAGGRCPECGKPVTVGVSSRVAKLADRPDGFEPDGHDPFYSLVPMHEVLGEILGAGPGSRKVAAAYDKLVDRVGPELYVLRQAPAEDLARHGGELLAEGISRMRDGQVIREAGYDGEYGVIRLFSEEERHRASGVSLLFAVTEAPVESRQRDSRARADAPDGAPRRSRPVETGGLDPEQAAAAALVDGPLLIVAGPGTGKTRTLTHRIARLVEEHGVVPEACLALTFTRRAANEMRQRLRRLLPGRGSRVPVTTFHGLGLEILREHGSRIGLPDGFCIVLPAERLALLAQALGRSEREAQRLLDAISRHKTGQTSESPDDTLVQACAAYEGALRERRAVDFDDLIVESVRLLEEHADVAAALRDRYRWLSIDEYQDVDALQYRLVLLLAGERGNVCAIGDPDQAIYGFRGADVRYFLRFARDYPAARTVRLSRNYRSSPAIVEGALQAVAPSSLVEDRALEALLDDPSRIVVHGAATDRAEAEYVAHGIELLIGGYGFFSVDSGRVDAGDAGSFGFSDIAVLYRTSAQLPCLEESLARAGIPFQSRGHDRLVDSPGVAKLIAALEGLSNGKSVVCMLAAAGATIGADDPQSEAAAALRLLEPLARRFGDDKRGFIAEVALGTEIDTWDPRAERVSLLTLHSAKGLEFDAVYLVGCEDGILPHRRTADQGEVAEERRLFFVGMTRAKRRLVLTRARRRRLHGKLRDMQPSPFLAEIEDRLLERSARSSHRPRGKPNRQMSLFSG